MKRLLLQAVAVLALTGFTPALHAHLGSADTFVQAQAGPHKFLLAAHPPAVYPGTLELDLRLNPDDHVTHLTAAVDNEAASPIRIYDAGTATASLWLSSPAAHTIQIVLDGNPYTLTLPAVAVPDQPENHLAIWSFAFASLVLSGFGYRLFAQGKQQPSQIAIAGAVMCVLAMVFALRSSMLASRRHGNRTELEATLSADGHLNFTLANPSETFDDLMPDHGFPVHLFLIRQPQSDVFLHLHPRQMSPGHFDVPLPAMPPGVYRIFADLYHADSRSETVTTTLELPSQQQAIASSNDSSAVLPPVSRVPNFMPVSLSRGQETVRSDRLPDGYTLQLQTDTTLHPARPYLLHLALLDPRGEAPEDMSLYLGMNAHAVVLRTDAADRAHQVFAHVHPGGTLPMPMPAQADGAMPGMAMPAPSNIATIPYGFPVSGRYRIFVQMKHGNTVETGAFDVIVQ